MNLLESLRAELGPDVKERVGRCMLGIEYGLLTAILRAKMNPELAEAGVDDLLRALAAFNTNLQHTAIFGQSDQPISSNRFNDLVAVLIGASMTANVSAEQGVPDEFPDSQTGDMHRFLQLVVERVGRLNPDNPRIAVLNKCKFPGMDAREVVSVLEK